MRSNERYPRPLRRSAIDSRPTSNRAPNPSRPSNANFPVQVYDSPRHGSRRGRRRRAPVISGRMDDHRDIADSRVTRGCRARRAIPSWACAGVLRRCRDRRLDTFPLLHLVDIRPRDSATLSADSAITGHATSRRCWRLRGEPLLPLLQQVNNRAVPPSVRRKGCAVQPDSPATKMSAP
jgi:hypothetical protein